LSQIKNIPAIDPSKDPLSPEFWRNYFTDTQGGLSLKDAMETCICEEAALDYDELERCSHFMSEVNAVLDDLNRVGVLSRENTILHIGCGTGTFAIRMAPVCQKVICVDDSERNLKRLKEKIQVMGLETNVEVQKVDWASYKPDKQYDVVFAFNSPILRSIEGIDSLLASTKKYLAVVYWAGIRRNPLLIELFKEIMDFDYKPATPDIVTIFNYLYSLGYAADLKFFRGCWTRTKDVESQIENLIWRLESRRKLTDEEKELVRKKAQSLAENGKLTLLTQVRIGYMLLDVMADKKSPCE